jgi:ceramide glucosyltransferase
MLPAILKTIEITATLCASGSVVYYLLCIWSAWKFVGMAIGPRKYAPPVSILKPLKGREHGMYEALRSHCDQDYADYEIVFGVSEADDPALELVEQLRREFPEQQIRHIVCQQKLGTNLKVSNLVQMLPLAKYEHIVVNDADIRVPADYLSRVMSPLADSTAGLVTCLYRGIPSSGLGSYLETLGISTDFASGVLVSRQIEGGLNFGLGSTLALRKKDLLVSGGFEKLLDFLADDYELGRMIKQNGQKVLLSDCVVQTSIADYNWRQFFEHQLRWSRTIRDARPWGYLGFGVTFGLWWALLASILSGNDVWPWMLLISIAALRGIVALFVGVRVLKDSSVLKCAFLIPIRDIVAFWIWVAGWFGNRITWRGQKFVLRHGRLVRTG